MANNILNNGFTFGNPTAVKPNNSNPKIHQTFSQDMQEVLKPIQGLNLSIEICGSWIWVFGVDSSHEDKLRAAKFTWSYKRGGWFLSPNHSKPISYSHHKAVVPMQKIRERYGSQLMRI